MSAAVIAVLEADHGLDRASAPLAAGLSLGEYTALWFAGALDLGDALRLVRLRGEAMQAASEACPSGMVSLMGATEDTATALAELGSAHGICQVANLNSPSQIIVSGELGCACGSAPLQPQGLDDGLRVPLVRLDADALRRTAEFAIQHTSLFLQVVVLPP